MNDISVDSATALKNVLINRVMKPVLIVTDTDFVFDQCCVCGHKTQFLPPLGEIICPSAGNGSRTRFEKFHNEIWRSGKSIEPGTVSV